MTAILLPAGFNLALRGEQLVFGDDVSIRETKTRTRGELVPVAREPQSCMPREAVQYWMYNDVCARADRSVWDNRAVQYELTLVLPHALGSECSKTLGHIHNAGYRRTKTFPEIFEVLAGTAYFLVYTLSPKKRDASRCGWVKAEQGEQIIMPPNVFHLSINAGDEPLVFADVISKRAHGIYDEVRGTHGAPYWFTLNHKWVRNPAFRRAAPLNQLTHLKRRARFVERNEEPLYTEFVRAPEAFRWLDE